MPKSADKVYIKELATACDRRESTVRSWCRTGRLPRNLMPKRSAENGWRYWTPAQIVGIRRWMVEQKMVPGAGLRNFNPTPEQSDEILAKLRETRRS